MAKLRAIEQPCVHQVSIVVDAVSLVHGQQSASVAFRECILQFVKRGVPSIKAFAPASFCSTEQRMLMVNQGLLFLTPPNVEDYILDYADRHSAFIVSLRAFFLRFREIQSTSSAGFVDRSPENSI